MELLNKLFAPKEEGDEKQKSLQGRQLFLLMILSGLLLLVIFLPVKQKDTDGAPKPSSAVSGDGLPEEGAGTQDGTARESYEDYARRMELRLEKTLKYMEGVGAVKVMVTLQSSEEAVVEKDQPGRRSNTMQSEAGGKSSSANSYENDESTVYVTDAQGGQSPYVVKRIEPSVEGVLVVAQGGGSAQVSKNITEAIEALFGIEPHKIKVVKMITTK